MPKSVSTKAAGKRKATSRDEAGAHDEEDIAIVSKTRRKLTLNSIAAGPFMDPRSLYMEGHKSFASSVTNYWIPPRAARLPFSRRFVEQLEKDVTELYSAFELEWKETESMSDSRGPFEVFVGVWRRLGWDLIQLQWGEDWMTRAHFFEATSRCLQSPLAHLKGSRSEHVYQPDVLIRSAAALFALLMLQITQCPAPNPAPRVAKRAFRWARKQNDAAEEDWDPFDHNGINKIKIEAGESQRLMIEPCRVALISRPFRATDLYQAIQKLPDEAERMEGSFRGTKSSSTAGRAPSNDDVLPSLSQDIVYCLVKLSERQAFHVLPPSNVKGMRCPPRLPLYEEVSEGEKLGRSGEWGQLVRQSAADLNGGDRSAKTDHPISRSDLIKVRVAEALHLPLREAFDEVASDGHPPLQVGEQDDLTYKSDRTPHFSLYKGFWLDRPFRPLSLPRLDRWDGEGGEGGQSQSGGAKGGLRGQLHKRLEDHRALLLSAGIHTQQFERSG